MKRLSVYLILSLLMVSYIRAQQADSLFAFDDSSQTIKRPWRSAFQTAGLNVGVWAFDRYAMNADLQRSAFIVSGKTSRLALFGIMISSPPIFLLIPITGTSILTRPAVTA